MIRKKRFEQIKNAENIEQLLDLFQPKTDDKKHQKSWINKFYVQQRLAGVTKEEALKVAKGNMVSAMVGTYQQYCEVGSL